MNWDAIGAVGEILGALAVFVSLIYLATQTKQNARALKSASSHQIRESISDLSLVLAQDPALNSLLLRATSEETDFTKEELARYNFFVLTMLCRAKSA